MPAMDANLTTSYRYCRDVAWRAGSNFCFSFLLLPRTKRNAMFALYAFLRQTDDLGDSEQPIDARRAALQQWREALHAALQAERCDGLWPALADTVRRWSIPAEYLTAAVDGVETDLDTTRYQTFDELRTYCYHVASVVGLACIHIWEFRDSGALRPAEQCGVAMQMTNILRDLREDARRGRVYLPQDDLRRFGCTNEQLLDGAFQPHLAELMRFEIARTEQLYEEAAQLTDFLSPEGRRIYRAMTAVYRALLGKIKRQDGNVFDRRIRVGRTHKLAIAAGAMLSR